MVPVVGLLAGVGFAKMRFCFYPGYFTVFTEGIIEVVNEKEEQRKIACRVSQRQTDD
jgi:hypothetical protein